MGKIKVLVTGSGGREHALAWCLSRSASVSEVHGAPGNPGIAEIGPVWPVAATDTEGTLALAGRQGYDLVVVGPEAPLAAGLADRLRADGTAVFGPGADGAKLESSKAHAKTFMARHGIPSAPFRVVRDVAEGEAALRDWGAPLVVKASGLAAGKGVVMAETEAEVRRALRDCIELRVFGEASYPVVLEKKLEGEEASVFVITDGDRYHLLPGAQDHKRAQDGDRGPNTGGMGATSPAPVLTPELLARVETTIVRPTLAGLKAEGVTYRGILYVGLMTSGDGPQVLEYNVRFGDPETQAVLPRLGGDLGALFLAAAQGELGEEPIGEPAHAAAACVVAAAADYPRSGARGLPITGLEEARSRGAIVFQAGTARDGDDLVASGGRVLNLVGLGDSLRQAVDRAYAGMDAVHFEGMRYRRDIGHRALSPSHVSGTP